MNNHFKTESNVCVSFAVNLTVFDLVSSYLQPVSSYVSTFLLLLPAAKHGTSLGLPRVFLFIYFYLCRGLQPLDVILDILDSGYIWLFDITEKPSLAYTVRTQ